MARIERADWLVLAVKNDDLEAVARDIRARVSAEPTQPGIRPMYERELWEKFLAV